MSNSKIAYFLDRTPTFEIKTFQNQLSSSPKKRDKLLGQLLALLVKGLADNERLYKKLYPGKAYAEKQIRNLRSELFGRLTDFLAHQRFDESPEKTLFVAKSMNQIQATKHFPAILDKYVKQEKARGLSLDQADLNNRLFSEQMLYKLADQGRHELPLAELIRNSEEAFVARMLYYAVAYHKTQDLYDREITAPPLKMWPAIQDRLEAGDWEDSILVQLYYSLYQLAHFPEEPNHFQSVKEKLTAYGELITKEELLRGYSVARNYCIWALNRGELGYMEELFQVFQEMRERDLLLTNSVINPWVFKSIVKCGVKLGKFEWSREFMDEYAPHLLASHALAMKHFCMGMIAFFEKQYSESERQMNQVLEHSSDPFLHLDARSYLLRVYYESGDFTGMDALTNSYRVLLARHKNLASPRLKNYESFLRYFRRLTHLHPSKQNFAKKLQTEILESDFYAERDWILEKITEIFPNLKSGASEKRPERST